MTARLNPYLAFRGNAREAMDFYASIFGGELTAMTFAEMGGMGMPEDEQHLVMHADLVVEEGIRLMGSDQPSSIEASTNGTVSLSGDDEERLRGWYDGLAEGGTVTMPLEKAPWGDSFGQLTDRFGIAWMFNVAGSGGA
jgi:PhnB protein